MGWAGVQERSPYPTGSENLAHGMGRGPRAQPIQCSQKQIKNTMPRGQLSDDSTSSKEIRQQSSKHKLKIKILIEPKNMRKADFVGTKMVWVSACSDILDCQCGMPIITSEGAGPFGSEWTPSTAAPLEVSGRRPLTSRRGRAGSQKRILHKPPDRIQEPP